MGWLILEENLFVKYKIIDNTSPEGKKIHDFLASRSELLAGRVIDFEKTPITFVMSDSDQPNAFFAPSPKDRDKPKRDEYENRRYIKNPLETPVICITKGLIDMVDNIDQLDYVLGHELTHMIIDGYGVKRNSKGEEELSDLHSVDLVYDAGSDPKEALVVGDKIHEYGRKHAEEVMRRQRRQSYRDRERGVNWSEILDVHMTHRNRRTALEASLTRLSHLIDDLKPSEIDKTIFDVQYSDPVEAFLKENDYDNQKAVGKLRILIDAIDHLSTHVPAKEFYQEKLDALIEKEKETDSDKDFNTYYDVQRSKEKIKKSIKEGYPDYFHGQTIEKKYQQKIVALAEELFQKVGEERQEKSNPNKPAAINVSDLDVYLQNKAYQYINEHGYPEEKCPNFSDASGIMYTYFYTLFGERHSQRRHYDPDAIPPRVVPKLETYIADAQEQIRNAKDIETFRNAAENLKKFEKIQNDISSTSSEYVRYSRKLDNLSFIKSYSYGSDSSPRIFAGVEAGKPVPWNNLVEIAKTDLNSFIYVSRFLEEQGIEDYRVTHGKPYIRSGSYSCYAVNDDGVASDIKDYELDFVIKEDLVLQVYDYIKNYFDNEAKLFEEACNGILNIQEDDYKQYAKGVRSRFNQYTIAYMKAMEFVQLYNTLPQEERDERRRYDEDRHVLASISSQYKDDNPLPGLNKDGRVTFESNLLKFDNPIFQQYFGADLKQQLVARKEGFRQKFFDTAFEAIDVVADVWNDAHPKFKALEVKRSEIWNQQKKLKRDDPAYEKLEKESEALYKEIRVYEKKAEAADRIVRGITNSVVEKNDYWYQINKMSSQQIDMVADHVIADEKGILCRLLEPDHYKRFCDARHILTQQMDKAASGDLALTDKMQVVTRNLGYEAAETKEALKGFVDAQYKPRNRYRATKYDWFAHVLDSMRHLEKTPEIDLRSLARAIGNIDVTNPESYSHDQDVNARARYKSYANFMREGPLVELAGKAVNYKGNYEGLSFKELTKTVDSVIKLRHQLGELIERKTETEEYSEERGYYYVVKDESKPEHKRVLDSIDKNIRGAIRRAQYQALQNDNTLEKFGELYRLYNSKDKGYSGQLKRKHYLEDMIKKEKILEGVSKFSESEDFWPDDVLDHIKAYVYAKKTFLDDIALEDKLLNDILDKLEPLPLGEKKNECYSILLDKTLRASYPETRDRLFNLYSDEVSAELGMDDGSEDFQEALGNVLASFEDVKDKICKKKWDKGELLSYSVGSADKYILLRKLSDKVLSQEETSGMIKKACQVNLKSKDLVRSYLYGVGVDYLTEEMDRDSDTAKQFLKFLNSKGEMQDCGDMSDHIRKRFDGKVNNEYAQVNKEKVLSNTRPTNCKVLYENFWSAPLEARAVVIARILKSAVNGENGDEAENENKPKRSWECVFDLVMDNIISPDDDSVESKYARDIMHSYIKARSDYEREIILSAMMVANRNIGADAGNVGKALKLFLENMGPAEIKLGQAVASHPSTPESISKELQELKNMADIPPRWTIYDWIRAENIPEELWKDKHLGEVPGSGSYYTTIVLGEDDVLRILRPEAREKAVKGFKVMAATIEDLKKKDMISDLDYGELTASVAEMITQASRMSKIETDQDIGQKQYEIAQKIYNGVRLSFGGETFTLKVMDWKSKGTNWVVMKKANGPIFNDLPEDTEEQLTHKKNFAKGYIAFEMMNILSGGKFDHDKHGAQLCIDPETNEVGIFDTGAMALEGPSEEEQKLLGHVIYDVIKGAYGMVKEMSEDVDWGNTLGAILSDKIDELHKDNIDTQYLVEVKKGILALGDFFKVLDKEDVKELISKIDIYSQLSEHIKAGVHEKTTVFEKTQLNMLLASKVLSNDNDPVVLRAGEKAVKSDVESFAIPRATILKAGWFQDLFEEMEADNDEGVSPIGDFVFQEMWGYSGAEESEAECLEI